MLAVAILLLVIGALGALDIFYFHRHRCGLARRPESRTEAWLHVARGVIYTLQFALVLNLRATGAWYALFAILFAADVGIALADVAVEPASRRSQGGLPRGEYVMHIVLSVLVGAYLHGFFAATWAWAAAPTGLAWAPAALPAPLALAVAAMAAGCALCTLLELAELVDAALPRPRPLHVAIRLRCTVAALWAVTQDHLRHPEWDHRFSRIVMLSDRIEAGTLMRYEKRLGPLTIRGHGRYKLHRPLQQSTFEFWSADVRSLIRRGVGLWRYRDAGDGTAELRTSYTYEVRWGLVGRWIDRLLFRPLLQRETERSFRRLARRFFPAGASPVAGRHGRKLAALGAAMSS